MCRLFGAISTQPIDAARLLWRSPRSLAAQSDIDKKRKQGDGWGLGWFERGRPTVYKSPEPMYRDGKSVRKAASLAKGSLMVGHVRWASNPLKLARRELIGTAHTQPFQHKNWLFAHNGTLFIPREATAALGPWAKYIQGRNDSEVLFYWLMKTVVSGQGPAVQRLRGSLRGLNEIWQTCRKRYPLYKHPFHGLNWVLTDGNRLWAFCYVNAGGLGKSKALGSKAPYYQLQLLKNERSVTIASEPLTQELGWKPMRHVELLEARRTRGGVSTRSWSV